MTHGPFVNIRLFSSVSSAEEAVELGKMLVCALNEFGEVTITDIKKYWKIPEYYECAMELRAPSISSAILPNVMEKLGDGWHSVSALCSVWNRSEENHFVDKRVNWAEVEFFEV